MPRSLARPGHGRAPFYAGIELVGIEAPAPVLERISTEPNPKKRAGTIAPTTMLVTFMA